MTLLLSTMARLWAVGQERLLNPMRRRLRGLSLLVFSAGVIVILIGAVAGGIGRSRPQEKVDGASKETRGYVIAGLGLQVTGAVGYLAFLSRSRRRQPRQHLR